MIHLNPNRYNTITSNLENFLIIDIYLLSPSTQHRQGKIKAAAVENSVYLRVTDRVCEELKFL